MMGQPTHVTFFGASVTEQSVHHATQERTGFVNYFEDELAEAHGFTVSRLSAGSSDVMDGGVVYVEKVLDLKPDICVLDWVTPGLTECDPRIIRQVYYRLMEHDILPVTVLFPRTDRVQKDIPIAQEMAQICAEFGLPIHDVADLLGDISIDTILRDVVHTNALGAEVYAKIVLDILKTTELPKAPLPKPLPPFQVLTVEPTAKMPLHSKSVQVDIQNPVEEPTDLCLVMEQRVGPYSPVLEIEIATSADSGSLQLDPFPIFDPWCHRERQCIKRITNWFTAEDLRQISLKTSQQTPSLVKQLDVEDIPAAERHLKPRGALYVVANRVVLSTVKW